MFDLLSIRDIAKDLRKSRRTVLRLVESGKLSALTKPRGDKYAYMVPMQEYLNWKMNGLKTKNENDFISEWDLVLKEKDEWVLWLQKGLLTGKPLCDRTIEDYTNYLKHYFDRVPRRYRKTPLISLNNLRGVFANINPKSFCIKDHIYKALMSFVKYLIARKLVKKDLMEDLKQAKPKRLYPPKRLHCTLNQFNKLLEEAGKKHHCQKPYDVLLNKTLIATLGYTGLRASELCNLRMEDIDLINKRIFVYLGKGRKNRYIGISNKLYDYLTAYLEARPKTTIENFFVTISSSEKMPVAFTREVLLRKVSRLSKITGININVHGLRRSFATIAANSGKPINIISLALGHSDLKTTQGYLMTTQDEVINAMKDW